LLFVVLLVVLVLVILVLLFFDDLTGGMGDDAGTRGNDHAGLLGADAEDAAATFANDLDVDLRPVETELLDRLAPRLFDALSACFHSEHRSASRRPRRPGRELYASTSHRSAPPRRRQGSACGV